MYIQEKTYIPFAAAMIFAALPLALLMHELAALLFGARGLLLAEQGGHYALAGYWRDSTVWFVCGVFGYSEYPAVGGAGENRPSENDAPPLALCAVSGGHRRVRVGVCRLHYRKRGRQRGLGRNARHRRFLLHPERVRTGDVFPAQTAHPRTRADGRVLQTEKIRQRPSENIFQTAFAFIREFVQG